MNKIQKINCNVYSCKYCNCDCNKCMLDEISIENIDNNMKKEDTMCTNYKKEK